MQNKGSSCIKKPGPGQWPGKTLSTYPINKLENWKERGGKNIGKTKKGVRGERETMKRKSLGGRVSGGGSGSIWATSCF